VFQSFSSFDSIEWFNTNFFNILFQVKNKTMTIVGHTVAVLTFKGVLVG